MEKNHLSYRLKLRRVAVDTYRENVAYLHRECSVYRAEGFQALAKIEVYCDDIRVQAVLNVVDDAAIVTPEEVGLSEQAYAQFNVKEGGYVRVAQAEPPASMDAVRRKIGGERLSFEDYRAITRDIAQSRYSKMEMAAFLVADKHCIGGIPGNRTSMLLVPIVAAHGTLIPKTSSRPSPRPQARPIPWKCSPGSSWSRTGSTSWCASNAAAWRGAVLHGWRPSTTC